jgi:mannose-6-phosphate isomerase-like protein (cupin superfamily)
MKLEGLVDKGWGSEYIWATNDKYCGKFLNFQTGSKFSMHFHAHKDETWYVLSGKFEVRYILTGDASERSEILEPGQIWRNEPLEPHQLICLEQGTIVEVSTPDSVEDNYRIAPGDSQK